jgi:hypothetical protein
MACITKLYHSCDHISCCLGGVAWVCEWTVQTTEAVIVSELEEAATAREDLPEKRALLDEQIRNATHVPANRTSR